MRFNFLSLKGSLIAVLKKLAAVSIGATLLAITYNALIMPYGLLSGGIAGISLILNYIMGFPVQWGIFLLNIPVFLVGFKELNRSFMLYSMVGILVLVFAIPVVKPYILVPEIDIFLASIFSGIVGGVGIGIALKFGLSFGGTDIIGMIMKKKLNISIGGFAFSVNLIILAISLLFFPIKIALYTVISMWVSSKVINAVLDGFNRYKSVTIITDKSNEIADSILKQLNRGVTFLEGQGAFSGQYKKVVNCVVNHFEIARIKNIVVEIDPYAFMFITETIEVSGKGFTYPKDHQKEIPVMF